MITMKKMKETETKELEEKRGLDKGEEYLMVKRQEEKR